MIRFTNDKVYNKYSCSSHKIGQFLQGAHHTFYVPATLRVIVVLKDLPETCSLSRRICFWLRCRYFLVKLLHFLDLILQCLHQNVDKMHHGEVGLRLCLVEFERGLLWTQHA